MIIQPSGPDLVVPPLMVIPDRPLRWQRQCLDPLFQAHMASPDAQRAWSEVQLENRVELFLSLEQESQKAAQEQQQRTWDLIVARYEAASCKQDGQDGVRRSAR